MSDHDGAEEPPFIPHGLHEDPLPAPHPGLWRNRAFVRLWSAQVVSSLGDWIGVVAILALAARVSSAGGAAIGLVMTARMLPGFILAPIGGALVDRFDRKRVMVICNLGRAVLIALIPFWHSLLGLVVLSFLIEILTLLWAPAKEATVPNVVRDGDQLAAANSLGLVAGYGTFPLGAVVFAALAGLSGWLGERITFFAVDQESLALWFNSGTFLLSAALISRLDLPAGEPVRVRRIDWGATLRDIVEGLRFIRSHPVVRGVMIGLAGGLLGGGAVVPLGPVFARDVLGGGSAGFGLLMTALGTGAALGVLTLLAVQKRLPREQVFTSAVATCGLAIIAAAATSTLGLAILAVAVVGATAGTAYVTGFTVLQESVHDALRGRTFATLYTVVRLCLLLALTMGPFTAQILESAVQAWAPADVAERFPGVRLALFAGGAITVLAAVLARRRMRIEHRRVPAAGVGGDS